MQKLHRVDVLRWSTPPEAASHTHPNGVDVSIDTPAPPRCGTEQIKLASQCAQRAVPQHELILSSCVYGIARQRRMFRTRACHPARLVFFHCCIQVFLNDALTLCTNVRG